MAKNVHEMREERDKVISALDDVVEVFKQAYWDEFRNTVDAVKLAAQTDIDDAHEKYHEKIDRMVDEYERMKADLREEYRRKIKTGYELAKESAPESAPKTAPESGPEIG